MKTCTRIWHLFSDSRCNDTQSHENITTLFTLFVKSFLLDLSIGSVENMGSGFG